LHLPVTTDLHFDWLKQSTNHNAVNPDPLFTADPYG
jgi:hypothetical protein